MPGAYLPACLQGMLTEPARITGQDDVRLPENRCGCIYTIYFDGAWDAVQMTGVLCGDSANGLIPVSLHAVLLGLCSCSAMLACSALMKLSPM